MLGIKNKCVHSGESLARSKKLATGRSVGVGVMLRIGTVNVGTMSDRDDKVVDMLKRRKIDICCLQEIRWKESEVQVMGCYKFTGWVVRKVWLVLG